MPPIHLLIKPVSGNCNMRCKYCFYRDLTSRWVEEHETRMTLATLSEILKKALAAAEGECTVVFQGGEPTLAGLDFYRAAVALEKKHNLKNLPIHNSLQTNGLLIDEEWARFLAEENFLVGLSVDGDRDVHDLGRVDHRGAGSFDRVMKAAALFDRHRVEYNILAVVTARSARSPGKVYRFFRQRGFRYLQFIPCLDPLGEVPGGQSHSLTPELYGSFLREVFDLWYADLVKGDYVYIRQFENYVGLLTGVPAENCAMQGVCGRQLVVEADGSVYPCDFYALEEYRLGNLAEDSLAEIEAARDALGFVTLSHQVHPDCRACRYLPLCRGGCRRDREPVLEGTLSKNHLCPAYRSFFDHAANRLARLARHVLQNGK